MDEKYTILTDESEKVFDKQQSLFYDENELNTIEERLDLIKQLKRKYGQTILDIINYSKQSQQSLDDLLHAEVRLNELQNSRSITIKNIYDSCLQLISKRKEIANNIQKLIEK